MIFYKTEVIWNWLKPIDSKESRASSQLFAFHLWIIQPLRKGRCGLHVCQQHCWCSQDAIFACSHEACFLVQHEQCKKYCSPLLSSLCINKVFRQSNFKYLDDPRFGTMWTIWTFYYSCKFIIDCICFKQTVFSCYMRSFFTVAQNLSLKKACIR